MWAIAQGYMSEPDVTVENVTFAGDDFSYLSSNIPYCEANIFIFDSLNVES